MYLTCKQTDAKKSNPGSPSAMVGAGGSLLWDATGWDGEALKGSLEQEDAFLVERASKKKTTNEHHAAQENKTNSSCREQNAKGLNCEVLAQSTQMLRFILVPSTYFCTRVNKQAT